MAIDKQLASKMLARTDRTAAELEKLKTEGKIDPRLASKLVHDLDVFADNLQKLAFGEDGLAAWQAKVSKVLKRDSDEKFMETFQNPQKVLESESDEPYMHKSGEIETYDSDDTSQVTEKGWSAKVKPTKVSTTRKASAARPAARPEKRWAD